uniref:Endo/exonuclease/phosphatase domain-containing protein n=1 Tax=Trichobilharzia regenti TaxID=157069 RepID=A0AA85JG29_TRIRE|nr:unnamed protein product [Trichobilharzia regenti]
MTLRYSPFSSRLQHMSQPFTLASRAIDVCCVSETRKQDPSVVIHLTTPGQQDESSKFTLRVSGDATASSRGLAGVRIALSTRAEKTLLDWIPVDSRMCAVRLNGSVRRRKDCTTRRCLFVISAYAPTDCSSDETKDEFYQKLSSLVRKAKRSDIVVLASDINAQVGKLCQSEKDVNGTYGVLCQRTDSSDRLLQFCSDNHLFLVSTNFKHKERHCLTWRPPSSNPTDPSRNLNTDTEGSVSIRQPTPISVLLDVISRWLFIDQTTCLLHGTSLPSSLLVAVSETPSLSLPALVFTSVFSTVCTELSFSFSGFVHLLSHYPFLFHSLTSTCSESFLVLSLLSSYNS